ncbi:MAG TPA: type II secretion system F family protein [Polyangia bacterium]
MLGLIVLLIFAAVFLIALIIMSVISRGIEQYESRFLTRSARDLGEMFYFVDPRQLLILDVCCAVALGLLGFAVANILVGVLLAALGGLAPFYGIKHLRQKRLLKFEMQLVDSLTQMASAFKAGLSLPQAAENVAKEAPAPLGQEFGLFVKELKLGTPVEDALNNMAERVGSEDLHLVVTATNVARKLGGNMAEMFDIISQTIRERFRLEGRIRALTAQGKMQGWVVGAMPVILGLVLNYMRPDLMGPMLNSKFGYGLILAIAVMETMGIWMIRKIVAIDV